MSAGYPIHVEGDLDAPLSRWLWAVKWLLAIPHYVVLAFLWVAFAVTSAVAFFAILFTGRYPRWAFDFNVGVLRWSWRVGYYSYGALGTDRYPPFTLAEVPGYPARLDVEYPERLSRGLVLVKWWLLAIPHYLVVALLVGGVWFGGLGGLIGILVLVAAVVLAATGTYPVGVYDLVLGLNRWVLRVAAYAGLMTDEYPPFRLDMGGHEQHVLTVPAPPSPAPPAGPRGWTARRVVAVVAGALLLLSSFGLAIGGAVALWADRTQRDAAGYLSTRLHTVTTETYALASHDVDLRGDGWAWPSAILDTMRVRVVPHDASTPVFAGIARTADADRYLSGTAHAVVTDWTSGGPQYATFPGGAPETPPGDAGIWSVATSGFGPQSLVWPVEEGRWTLVVMNANGTQRVDVRTAVGVRLPALGWVAFGLLVGAATVGGPGAALVGVSVRNATTR